jgi:hypothetical protein
MQRVATRTAIPDPRKALMLLLLLVYLLPLDDDAAVGAATGAGAIEAVGSGTVGTESASSTVTKMCCPKEQ